MLLSLPLLSALPAVAAALVSISATLTYHMQAVLGWQCAGFAQQVLPT